MGKKLTLPEDIKAVELEELQKLLVDAGTRYGQLVVIDDDDLTDEQLDEMESLATFIATGDGEIKDRETAAEARRTRIQNAKTAVKDGKDDGEGDEGDGDEGTEGDGAEGDGTEGGEGEGTEGEGTEGAEAPAGDLVTASAARGGVAARAAKAGPKTDDKKPAFMGRASMTAGTDVEGFATGSAIKDFAQASEAFGNRVAGFPSASGGQKVSNRFGVMRIRKEVPEDFHLVKGDQAGNMARIMQASARAPKKNALVAAGGWCAPSQFVYDLCALETVSNILEIPEVTMDRGGIQFTKGPDFADIYTDSGFLQTETQAEAGTTKNFIDVECPEFSEVRLDAIGFGVRAGILTNRAYPELIQRYLEGVLVAHAHKVNASVISRIVTALGSAIDLVEYGSAYSDSFQGLEMQAVRLRYKYRLGELAPVEGFAPVWFKSVLRADLSYRMNANWESISDAQIDAELGKRGISLQWVYDWQDLTATGTTWPNTVSISLYTPGAFVKGTTDVISLDAVYDTAGLQVNTYTAAFFEEGLAVFNPCGSGVLATLTLGASGNQKEILGQLGYPSINHPVGLDS